MNTENDITVREAALEDAAAIWRALDSHREYLSVWLPFVPRMKGVRDEEKFLASVLAEPRERRNTVYVIERAGELCGLAGFVNADPDNRGIEIGYWLLPEYGGRGIMTRCVRRLCLEAVAERNVHRIQIRCAVGNERSNAIPRRLGFTLEGTLRQAQLLSSGEFADLNVYGILAPEVGSWSGGTAL